MYSFKEADTSAGSDENRPHEVDNTKMEVDGEGNAVKIEVIGLKELEVSMTNYHEHYLQQCPNAAIYDINFPLPLL